MKYKIHYTKVYEYTHNHVQGKKMDLKILYTCLGLSRISSSRLSSEDMARCNSKCELKDTAV